MADNHKPRHIRDIAHLYISRLEKRDPAPTTNVYILGTSKECFPGYHAANIAVGLTLIRKPVRVIELSGIWPCSAHFLSMPPQIYLRSQKQQRDEDLSAFGSVTLRFSARYAEEDEAPGTAGTRYRGRSPAAAFDVYHMPPVEDLNRKMDVVGEAVSAAGGDARVALLAMDETEADAAWRKTARFWGRADRYTILLAAPRAGYQLPKQVGTNVRRLSNWRRSLSDKLPCVVRAPDSYLSRAYASICEILSSKAPPQRGNNVPGFASRSRAAGQAW